MLYFNSQLDDLDELDDLLLEDLPLEEELFESDSDRSLLLF